MPWKEICWTFFLLVSLIYLFSIWTYTYFPGDYANNVCYSLYTCLIVNIDQTFKGDAGIGSFMEMKYVEDNEEVSQYDIQYKRILFDNIFNFLILMLVAELLAGIIIDTFGKLRE
jgi:inositol 1,4,5-triphosphate receptor type 1